MALSLLTINIWNDDGPWATRLPLLQHWIALLQPDVLLMQEVLRGPRLDQLALLAPPGSHVAFAPMAPFWNDRTLEIGVAIASRFPLLAQAQVALPTARADDARCALGAALATPAGVWPVFTTHFSYWPTAAATRLDQAIALAAFVRRTGDAWRSEFAAAAPLRLPDVVGGDLNERPDGDAVRFLTGRLARDDARAGYLDAWAMAGAGAGETMVAANPFVPRGVMPDGRIDYVLAGLPARSDLGRISLCRRVLDLPVKGVHPSDHFGVYVEFETP